MVRNPTTRVVGSTGTLTGTTRVVGSILATILTGKPAFVGNTMNQILIQTASADLSDVQARLAACGADAELLAIARRNRGYR